MRVVVRMMIVTGIAVAMLGCGSDGSDPTGGDPTGPQADSSGSFDGIGSGVDATTPDETTTTTDGTPSPRRNASS